MSSNKVSSIQVSSQRRVLGILVVTFYQSESRREHLVARARRPECPLGRAFETGQRPRVLRVVPVQIPGELFVGVCEVTLLKNTTSAL